ncbi:tripartite motif-containing protein 16-like isoform X1 [Xyrauchen texanus]|uniref:tripartite motif-containing protein 16-like isoform X1 n=1 Tax=Xyrauchen texanus TaxID=154827 RepID=UPI0022418BF4|nr:tripartite motif-containing protein 16-like isoform X1 [Xyrauchen texanus]XP_051966351.1 tripartite motif-containing protein 16-like isoform X1 [Xyrauchen texanus]XP_051966354.1 tripartite motif-containing protein 16-like isoform X4 [Xyrauchen texanus]XP_051966357.1 tripartite motif-containing protein 16-like isoform X7 [Xyrauchen texanus]XP_051966359.1 tripartite motif-containing protein 16-like isoform X1 [Xyrauchen texanus]XP_051966361.1 tripartite motif-containing protein 16-like isofor
MAESSESELQEQFSCSICLDPLKEPVTIPCGHSYCMSCITDCWDQKDQMPPYHCPQCRETFTQRPALKKNTVLAEMMEKLQKTSIQTASCSQEDSCVECDVCTTEKNRAVMSCLQCLASFCETHLQIHYQSPAFMKHKLVKVSMQIQENIPDNNCLRHDKPLDIYCQDDSQCICYLCMIDNHKGHSVVSVESEWTNKKKHLKETKEKCQNMTQDREKCHQELREAVKFLKISAQEAVEDSEKVFTELICSLEKKRSDIKDLIRAQEKAEIDRAEKLHKHLDQELTELRQRDEEIQKLLITDNQVHFLKSFQSICDLPITEDLPNITQHPHLSFKDISISAFKEALEDVCQQATAKISREVLNVHVAQSPEPKTLSEFLPYFCQLQLDPNTAHKNLILTEENRKVLNYNKAQEYPDHPERFNGYSNVLCREGLCGRRYWEVECSGDTAVIAVTYKSISRKGKGEDCRLGFNEKSWRLTFSQNKCNFRHNNQLVDIRAVRSSRIGVFLDHRAGTLSFYNVSDEVKLIHRVQTTFTEPLYAAFGMEVGSSVRIIKMGRIQTDQK